MYKSNIEIAEVNDYINRYEGKQEIKYSRGRCRIDKVIAKLLQIFLQEFTGGTKN